MNKILSIIPSEAKIILLGNVIEDPYILRILNKKYDMKIISLEANSSFNVILTNNLEILNKEDPDFVLLGPDSEKMFDKNILDIAVNFRRLLIVSSDFNFKDLFKRFEVNSLNIIKDKNKFIIEIMNN